MPTQNLHEGLDPTGLACITTSQLLQMIRNAYPYPNRGFILWNPIAPNVVANPELVNFLWGKQTDLSDDTTKTKEIYYYNGTSWELIPLEILDGSINLVKLNLIGANLYDILQVLAGPTLSWTSIITAIQNNTLPATKLIAPDNINKYILACYAGSKAFLGLVAFFAGIDPGIIPVAKLVPGPAGDPLGKVLLTDAGGVISWTSYDVSWLHALGSAAKQSIRRKSDNSGWEYYTPSVSAIPTFITPISVYSGGAVSWATYAGSMPTLTGKFAAILQTEVTWATATDGQATVSARADSLHSDYIIGRIGSTDAASVCSQSIIPVTADGKFDYQVVLSGTALSTSDIKLVGYIG